MQRSAEPYQGRGYTARTQPVADALRHLDRLEVACDAAEDESAAALQWRAREAAGQLPGAINAAESALNECAAEGADTSRGETELAALAQEAPTLAGAHPERLRATLAQLLMRSSRLQYCLYRAEDGLLKGNAE